MIVSWSADPGDKPPSANEQDEGHADACEAHADPDERAHELVDRLGPRGAPSLNVRPIIPKFRMAMVPSGEDSTNSRVRLPSQAGTTADMRWDSGAPSDIELPIAEGPD